MGCCPQKVKYECAVNAGGCPVKEVEENQPAPECCGQPMKKKA